MNVWSKELAIKRIFRFDDLSESDRSTLLSFLDKSLPTDIVEEQLLHRRKALRNLEAGRNLLSNVKQLYPECTFSNDMKVSREDIFGYAILLTAGGEGERLYTSLRKQGVPARQLHNFTKATFALPDFFPGFGTLHINLSLISKLCRDHSFDIPVVVSTGPEDSATARLIPSIINGHNSFGIKHLRIINQEERIHFTRDEKIVCTFVNNKPKVITNPDETGGPVMKLKKQLPGEKESTLDWLVTLGCNKIILLQATAIYNPAVIPIIASAGKKYDGLGIGIQRKTFHEDDPYGTFILIEKNKRKKLIIAEQEVRDRETLSLTDSENNYLPFNTGFYAFDIRLIQHTTLPEYATPPKEILPGLPKSPKTGYAATDIISLAKKPAVLTIPRDSFGVIKKAEDLMRLSKLGRKFGLDKLCKYI